jgi:hypothetical protein
MPGEKSKKGEKITWKENFEGETSTKMTNQWKQREAKIYPYLGKYMLGEKSNDDQKKKKMQIRFWCWDRYEDD